MFDTMTMTKIVLGFGGSLLVYLFGLWAAESIYHVGGGGHGDDHAQAYVIDTGEGDHEAEEEEVVDFAALLEAANTGKGEKVFGKCKACHKLDGSNGTGPYLNGIVDRSVATADGFGYSGALIAVVETWTPEALDAFLENPKKYTPGTKMSFAGLKKPEDRANLIAWLQTQG